MQRCKLRQDCDQVRLNKGAISEGVAISLQLKLLHKPSKNQRQTGPTGCQQKVISTKADLTTLLMRFCLNNHQKPFLNLRFTRGSENFAQRANYPVRFGM
jgi:hypothetical protein